MLVSSIFAKLLKNIHVHRVYIYQSIYPIYKIQKDSLLINILLFQGKQAMTVYINI